MKVYKFGGASVKDASGVRNLANIVSKEKENLVIVVSAFGKTTNALEKVLKTRLGGDKSYLDQLEEIGKYHQTVCEELFNDKTAALNKMKSSVENLKEFLSSGNKGIYDYEYDQVVSYGEIWSTIIVAEYLKTKIESVEWIDIRNNLVTDNRFRDANILWDESSLRTKTTFNFEDYRIYVTQGFIGGTSGGETTTLGREGSDYTAAILANMLDAERVVFWKDVPGMLNADPKWLTDAYKLDEISYKEAVEMTFSGAKVIHPKTIKPLHNKDIPLNVRSFLHPEERGTIIKADPATGDFLPVYIKKEDQILVSILPKDFSFVIADNLSRIFHIFMTNGIKVNLVEASAISLDVCIDDDRRKVEALLADLKSEFSAVYNENVEMLTIRHYTPVAVNKITEGREILLEQRTRSTVRFVVRQIASLRSQ